MIAISGGVDSAVAAIRLQEQGCNVKALHIKMLENAQKSDPGLESVKKIAETIGIELIVIDAVNLFRQKVINYFKREYEAARTPNPCVICNPEIKFRIGIDTALDYGCDFFATGHYAKIVRDNKTGEFNLCKGRDLSKDQSYFLHRLSATALPRIIFPIGNMKKKEVKELALKNGLSGKTEAESQEVCFLDEDYRLYLSNKSNQNQYGPICTRDGTVKGQHNGLFRYTVGQRRGLGIPGPRPYYVLELDNKTNTLIIGEKEELSTNQVKIKDLSWISGSPPDSTKSFTVKIRYRHDGGKARLEPLTDEIYMLNFQTPQRAVTPGQFAVIYDGEITLGGGVICG